MAKITFTVTLTLPFALVPSLAFGYSEWTADTFRYSQVRGFNEPWDISPASMFALAATGANVLRVPIALCPNATYASPCAVNPASTVFTYDPARIANLVASATTYGFKLVLSLSVVGGTYKNNQIWGTGAQGVSLQASLNSIWSAIAKQYNGNQIIAAFDILEEPVARNMAQWVSISTKIIDTIRTIDPNRVIIWEPTPWAEPDAYDQSYTYTADPLTNILPFTNIVYAFDTYKPRAVCMQGLERTVQETYPSPSGADLRVVLSGLRAFQRKYNVPIYVIAFGCVRWAPRAPSGLPSANNWSADAIALFESYGWSWNYHAWRSYFGWDPELPETFFYAMTPYTNALPNLNYSLYDNRVTPNDYDKTPIGFGAYRTNTNTMYLLKQYFQKNIH